MSVVDNTRPHRGDRRAIIGNTVLVWVRTEMKIRARI